jgi:hypothetical protein
VDWTFWVFGVLILGMLVYTQWAFNERRWSRKPRPEHERPIDVVEVVDEPGDAPGLPGGTDRS